MLIAEDAPESRLPQPPMTPKERAYLARCAVDLSLPDALVCRSCVLQVVEEIVRITIEDAEHDVRRRQMEDDSCRN